MKLDLIPLEDRDREWVRSIIEREWATDYVVVHNEIFYPHQLPGFLAMDGNERVGLITYRVISRECEIITLNCFRSGQGIGSALLEKVEETARNTGCDRCVLTTTNNNTNALQFYKKQGYQLVKILPGALEQARTLKPAIPDVDDHGVPIRDELLLAKQI